VSRRAVKIELVHDEPGQDESAPRPLDLSPQPLDVPDAPAPAGPARGVKWPRLAPSIGPWRAVELLLLALIAVQCARVFWVVVTPIGPIGAWSAPVPLLPAPPPVQAVDFDPFFRIAAPQGPVVVTSLDLTLHGVRENRATGLGSAIIGLPDGRQQSFAVGEEIMEGVTLSGVSSDSVTISRGGATEQMFLGSGAPPAQDAAAPPATRTPQ